MNTIVLNNNGPCDSVIPNIYYPRLQINKKGEIVLATGKKGTLTTGILVAKTPECKSPFPIGKKFDDWEVGGELTDYDREVTVTFINKQQATSKQQGIP
jgi:hypothetical protein